MLEAAELAQIRSDAERLLPDVANLRAPTREATGGGGYRTTYPGPGVNVPCRIAPISGAEITMGSRVAADSEWILTVPVGSALTTETRVAVGGRTFDVTALRGPRSWEVTLRAELKAVTG